MTRAVLAGLLLLVGCGGDPPLREASAGERRQMEASVHGWLSAMADGDGKAACTHVSEESLENGPPCEPALDRVRAKLVEEGRDEFRDARIKRAFIRGDDADVTLDARTQYTGELLTRTLKLKREDGSWKIAGIGLDAGDIGEVPQCNVDLMHQWETGNVDRSWKREGRAVFREYAERLCRAAAKRDLLSDDADGRRIDKLIEQVQRKMIREGRIRPAGG
jgi:hypothetical protein